VAELDRHRHGRQRVHHRLELVEPVPAGIERRRELKQERAQLVRVAQRPEDLEGARADLRLQLGVSATRPRSLTSASARRSVGSEESGAAWRESSRWSLTSNVNPGGVIAAQRATARREGVERRVDLDAVEALRVPGQPVAGRQPARIRLLGGQSTGPDHDAPGHPAVLPRIERPIGRIGRSEDQTRGLGLRRVAVVAVAPATPDDRQRSRAAC
jgi:hypothetical protein